MQIKKLTIARNLSKLGRNVVEVVSADAVSNISLSTLNKIPNC